MSKLKDSLKELFSTDDPSQASRDRNGAVETQAPPKKERQQGDYLPIIAVTVGVALLAVAYLKPQRVSLPLQRSEDEDQTSGNDWQTMEQDFYR